MSDLVIIANKASVIKDLSIAFCNKHGFNENLAAMLKSKNIDFYGMLPLHHEVNSNAKAVVRKDLSGSIKGVTGDVEKYLTDKAAANIHKRRFIIKTSSHSFDDRLQIEVFLLDKSGKHTLGKVANTELSLDGFALRHQEGYTSKTGWGDFPDAIELLGKQLVEFKYPKWIC